MDKVYINKVSQGNYKHLVGIQAKKSPDQLMINDKNKSFDKSIEGELFYFLFWTKK
jgi:hypothetical protein